MTIELELPGINVNSLKEAPIHLFKHIQPHGGAFGFIRTRFKNITN